MFDVVQTFMIQLIDWLPGLVAIFILFDLIGTLLFERR